MPRQTSDHSSEFRAARQRLIGAELERCIYCQGTDISRHGKRIKKLETVQLWKCQTCKRVFTPQQAKGKTYPLKIILESLMLYYLGDTRERTAKHIKERFGITVPLRTLSAWLAEYRGLTTYARLRPSASAGRSAPARAFCAAASPAGLSISHSRRKTRNHPCHTGTSQIGAGRRLLRRDGQSLSASTVPDRGPRLARQGRIRSASGGNPGQAQSCLPRCWTCVANCHPS